MNTNLLNYNVNIEYYLKEYEFFFNCIRILLIKKYNKMFKMTFNCNDIIFYNELINNYIKHTNKNHLFELRSNDNKHFYLCIGNFNMLNFERKYYGNYFLVLHFRSTLKLNHFELLNFKQYLHIEEFTEKYKLVDQDIIYKIKDYYEKIK